MDQFSATQLMQAAETALQRRDVRGALELLRRAESAGPATPQLHMSRAAVLRALGDGPGAIASLDAALALEPYNFIALLSKGALIERMGQGRQAARVYKDALQIAPAPDQLPPGLQAPLQRAREVVASNRAALREHLERRLAELRARHGGERLDRFDEALGIFVGEKRVYNQEPLLLHYPQLPAIPFYDRSLFPWLGELEAATPAIQEELAAALEQEAEAFVPYIAYPPGAPVNQWGELNHSRRWSSFFLWRDGERMDAACARCPRTSALMDSLPLARQPGFAPTVVFSALEPHTHIPPHTGSSNTRLLVHLPLVIPGPARFRVGNAVREWRVGQAWVFDDTIEHEAWNDADQLRVILILDVWNPYLSQAERELVSAMLVAARSYDAE